MSKLVFGSILAAASAVTIATGSAAAHNAQQAAKAPPACISTTFQTELVKEACAKGGQHEANNVMKAFMKEKKIKSCNQCHAALEPKYGLKANGLDQFRKAGGK
ncbi:MAG: hypothetical protein ABJE47_15175 [bacterium]